MGEFMASRPYVFVRSLEEGAQRVRDSKGVYAFLLESLSNDYINR